MAHSSRIIWLVNTPLVALLWLIVAYPLPGAAEEERAVVAADSLQVYSSLPDHQHRLTSVGALAHGTIVNIDLQFGSVPHRWCSVFGIDPAVKLGFVNCKGLRLLADRDLLDKRMATLSPNGIDCGRVEISGNPVQETDCTLAAFHGHKAFRVRFDMQGIDSYVAIALVGLPDGNVVFLDFDGDPVGGGGISPTRARVTERACPTPVNLVKTRNGRLSCFPE